MTEEQEDFYYGEPLPGGGFAHALKFQGHEVILIHRRTFYRDYNEIPVRGPFGMNPKVAKFIATKGLGLVFAAAIGYMIKMEKRIEDRIEDHYAPPKDDTTEED